jgi:hypothetical protein
MLIVTFDMFDFTGVDLQLDLRLIGRDGHTLWKKQSKRLDRSVTRNILPEPTFRTFLTYTGTGKEYREAHERMLAQVAEGLASEWLARSSRTVKETK